MMMVMMTPAWRTDMGTPGGRRLPIFSGPEASGNIDKTTPTSWQVGAGRHFLVLRGTCYIYPFFPDGSRFLLA
jgi:hypothetical protein